MLLLAMVFRSVVVPVKAAVMNLLSIGAAYGVLTAVFQWGWGAELLGLDHAMPVSSWVPILMFAILFGLSMDYEVFLLSRIREDWLATGDAARQRGPRALPSPAGSSRRAAAIMVAVFLGFASEVDVVVKHARRRHGRRDPARRDRGPDGAGARRRCRCSAAGTGGCPRWLDRLLPTIAPRFRPRQPEGDDRAVDADRRRGSASPADATHCERNRR